jgi:hypothetical protein
MFAKTSNKHMISKGGGKRDWKMHKKRMSFKTKKKHDEKEKNEMMMA